MNWESENYNYRVILWPEGAPAEDYIDGDYIELTYDFQPPIPEKGTLLVLKGGVCVSVINTAMKYNPDHILIVVYYDPEPRKSKMLNRTETPLDDDLDRG